jgi:hypothetical protein
VLCHSSTEPLAADSWFVTKESIGRAEGGSVRVSPNLGRAQYSYCVRVRSGRGGATGTERAEAYLSKSVTSRVCVVVGRCRGFCVGCVG